jgi:hypothetical protein
MVTAHAKSTEAADVTGGGLKGRASGTLPRAQGPDMADFPALSWPVIQFESMGGQRTAY